MSPRTFDEVRQRSRNQSIVRMIGIFSAGSPTAREDQGERDEPARRDAPRADAGDDGRQDDDDLVGRLEVSPIAWAMKRTTAA